MFRHKIEILQGIKNEHFCINITDDFEQVKMPPLLVSMLKAFDYPAALYEVVINRIAVDISAHTELRASAIVLSCLTPLLAGNDDTHVAAMFSNAKEISKFLHPNHAFVLPPQNMNLQFLRRKKSKQALIDGIAALLTRLYLHPNADELAAIESIGDHAAVGGGLDAFVTQIAEPVELILKHRGNGYTFSFNTDSAPRKCPGCDRSFKPAFGICPQDYKGNLVCRDCEDLPEPAIRRKVPIPTLDLSTGEFRTAFPTDNDFFDFINKRNELLSDSPDNAASQLANTISRCPAGCGVFTPVTDWVGIAYTEKTSTTSAEDLAGNFYGCAHCFVRHLEKHADRSGRVGF